MLRGGPERPTVPDKAGGSAPALHLYVNGGMLGVLGDAGGYWPVAIWPRGPACLSTPSRAAAPASPSAPQLLGHSAHLAGPGLGGGWCVGSHRGFLLFVFFLGGEGSGGAGVGTHTHTSSSAAGSSWVGESSPTPGGTRGRGSAGGGVRPPSWLRWGGDHGWWHPLGARGGGLTQPHGDGWGGCTQPGQGVPCHPTAGVHGRDPGERVRGRSRKRRGGSSQFAAPVCRKPQFEAPVRRKFPV